MIKLTLNGRLLDQVKAKQARAMSAVGGEFLRDMASTLGNSPARTGNTYDFYKGHLRRWQPPQKLRGRVHVASRIGEPPALLTGDLRRRRASRLSHDGETMVLSFGSNVPYARRLELEEGKERPAWQRTWSQNRRRYGAVFEIVFKRAA